MTSSNDFKSTLNQIIAGLNSAGFSRRDFRVSDENQLELTNLPAAPTSTGSSGDTESEEFLGFDETKVATDLRERGTTATETTSPTPSSTSLAGMLEQAQQKGSDYEKEAEEAAELGDGFVPADLESAVDTTQMFEEFRDEVASLKLPQFVIQTPPSALFSTGAEGVDLLQNEALAADFTLQDKNTGLDLTTADEQMYRIDVKTKSDVPRAFRMTAADQRFMREHFSKLSVESQKRNAAEAIYERLKPINSVGDSDLRHYIERVIDNFGAEELLTYQEHPGAVAEKIRAKIRGLLDDHKFKKFYRDIETRHIGVQPSFAFPSVIQPVHSSSLIGGSLYEAEDRMNNDEMEFAGRFSGLDNIRWWHRNIERKGFCINGPINHYPDFILMTTRGTVVIVEPKGAQLKNEDSRRKVRLGNVWASMAGEGFRYYMVFQDGVEPLEGAYTSSQFFQILEQL